MKKIIAVIPAREGSKGLKLKNIRTINKKPLINFTIEEALKSKFISKVFLSTESDLIRSKTKQYKNLYHHFRPKYLAKDKIETIDVILNLLSNLNEEFDYLILLQPTCPLRTAEDIDVALKNLLNSNFDSIVSVCDVDGNHPYRMKIIKNGRLENFIKQNGENMTPRQLLPKVYIRNGSIYASKIKMILKNKSLVNGKVLPFVMSKLSSVNIDNEDDFYLATRYLKKLKKKPL